jgi:hypothetical protein
MQICGICCCYFERKNSADVNSRFFDRKRSEVSTANGNLTTRDAPDIWLIQKPDTGNLAGFPFQNLNVFLKYKMNNETIFN